MGKTKAKQSGSPVVADAARTAESAPLDSGHRPGGGHSVLSGFMVQDNHLVKRTGLEFVDSPYGERYISRKPRSLSVDDVAVRMEGWAFDVKGYWDSGTIDNANRPSSELLGHNNLQDWYSQARETGKRSIKYKHTPTTLTNSEVPRHWMNVYATVGADLIALSGVDKLSATNTAFAYLGKYISKYISRINRAYARLSAIPAPVFLKKHMVRMGMIVEDPMMLCPYIRLWSPAFWLASGSGGPTWEDQTQNLVTWLINDTYLGKLVANLEVAERWLENGASAIIDDFIAFRDVVDMTIDVGQPAWSQGLPDIKTLPAVSQDPWLLTDILARAFLAKEVITAGTDKLYLFPLAGMTTFGVGRIPIAGFGGVTNAYDFDAMGAVKYGYFNSDLTLGYMDTGSAFRLFGTDIRVGAGTSVMRVGQLTAEDAFGHANPDPDEYLMREGAETLYTTHRALERDSDMDVFAELDTDGVHVQHIWYRWIAAARTSLVANRWSRFINEGKMDYMFYPEVEDFGEHYGQYILESLDMLYQRSIQRT